MAPWFGPAVVRPGRVLAERISPELEFTRVVSTSKGPIRGFQQRRGGAKKGDPSIADLWL